MSAAPPSQPERSEQPAVSPTVLQSYWDRVSLAYAGEDPLAAVCYPGAPRWFNRFFAALQWRAVKGCLGSVSVAGRRALDVGCGFGRWARWLAGRGASAIGVDPTAAMLDAARRISRDVAFERASATALGVRDASCDLVLAITVLQHLKPAEQVAAIAEICRVVRPGGYVLVLDLIDQYDRGSVVFPRSAINWIDCYSQHGMQLERWRGQEYVPLIRIFRWVSEWIGRLLGLTGPGPRVNDQSLIEQTRGRGAFRVGYAVLWCIVQVSRPLERVCEWTLPHRWARHGCFLFRKAALG